MKRCVSGLISKSRPAYACILIFIPLFSHLLIRSPFFSQFAVRNPGSSVVSLSAIITFVNLLESVFVYKWTFYALARDHTGELFGVISMGLFEGVSKVVFVFSYVLWAGGGLLVSVFMLPMRDPRTEAQVQGYLYTFWETIRISAIAITLVVAGASISMIFINSASTMWSLMFFISVALTSFLWYRADRVIRKGASDPRSIIEVDKRNFERYLVFADFFVSLSMVSAAFLVL